jgi:hypothetical protein
MNNGGRNYIELARIISLAALFAGLWLLVRCAAQ